MGASKVVQQGLLQLQYCELTQTTLHMFDHVLLPMNTGRPQSMRCWHEVRAYVRVNASPALASMHSLEM